MTHSHTRTGHFPIGFRRPWGAECWKDSSACSEFARNESFAFIDVPSDAIGELPSMQKAGLGVGSIDLPGWKGLISPNAATRLAAINEAGEFVEIAARAGSHKFFVVMLPEDPSRAPRENFDFMVESFRALAPVLEAHASCIVIEGWPGPGALCCTPESLRLFFAAIPSPSMAINYDPSHLVRMGIDPVRFLTEFAGRVRHVHAKDTEILANDIYEMGFTLPALAQAPRGFGGPYWRYTIPGHGCVPWTVVFDLLQKTGYSGGVSIELEDMHFHGAEDAEKRGLLLSKAYLEGC